MQSSRSEKRKKMVSNYVTGRNRETQRLAFLRRTKRAVIGGRFRGSKISKGWIKSLGFNPKLDLWWLDGNGIIHFEQFKSAKNGKKQYISKEETASVQRFADKFYNYNSVWIGITIKQFRIPASEIRLN